MRESRERVRAALLNSELEFPQQRITANLAPASLRKAGPGFDLAIAVAVLAASGQLPAGEVADAVCGELSLSGEIRPVRGALVDGARGARGPACARLRRPGGERARGGARRRNSRCVGVPTLAQLGELLHGRWEPQPAEPAIGAAARLPTRRASISPTSAGRPTRGARSRSRRPAATTC